MERFSHNEKDCRIAIVHDWLVTYAGSEQVLEQLILCYPTADVYTLVDFVQERDFLQGKLPITSLVQKLPMSRKLYRNYLPVMAFAVEQFDLSRYDIVISSNHAVSKGVITGPDQLHISYMHTPMRYAWDLQHQYLAERGLARGFRALVARWLLHRMRQWDYLSSARVDRFVANSHYIARRIGKVYRREATVIYPPVDVSFFEYTSTKEDFYVTVARIVPYKMVHVIVDAFRAMPDKRLFVIGGGPGLSAVQKSAPPNVTVLGHQPRCKLRDYMQRAKAFVYAAEEDFGIVPIEAQACGTPVIAYGKGGVAETVRGLDTSRPTGIFFQEQSAGAICEAIQTFEAMSSELNLSECRKNALRFSKDKFKANFTKFVSRECYGNSW